MVTPSKKNRRQDLCDDLLIQHAIYGLDSEEYKQMVELRSKLQQNDDDGFELTIGALDSGFSGVERGEMSDSNELPLPTKLRAKIISESASHLPDTEDSGLIGGAVPSHSEMPTPGSEAQAIEIRPFGSESGWSVREMFFGFIAAASLLFAMASFTGIFSPSSDNRTTPDAPATFAEQLQQFETRDHPDIRTVSWTNPTKDAASIDASGKVVWSDKQQRGYMVFDGLQTNDATKQQYQLWIFDTARDDALPVDGGVFDITTEGTVIVPIDAKLSITQAKMFAVTIEKPGGVVQSKRDRLPLLATVGL